MSGLFIQEFPAYSKVFTVNTSLSTSKPTVYMWWLQTMKPKTPIDIMA